LTHPKRTPCQERAALYDRNIVTERAAVGEGELRCHSIAKVTILESHQFVSLPGIRHFVSTRLGGVSPAPFDALNLGFRDEPTSANVAKNRCILAAALGLSSKAFVFASQTHSSNVRIVHDASDGDLSAI